MSFAHPLVLLALLGLLPLAAWYAVEQRRRRQGARAFAAAALAASVAPRHPRWRRHAPLLAFAIALAVLIAAAAKPQRTVAKPLTNGAIMLADDISSSMEATDVAPTREQAARQAALRFLARIPPGVQVGLLEFARTPIVLQSPSSDHALTAAALRRPLPTSGGTAVGEAILAALHQLTSLPRVGGRRPPGAIVLISDGFSNVGIDPLIAARQAAADHVPIYTVSIGTPRGEIPVRRRGGTVMAPVPVSGQQLAHVASLSGGRAFTASDAGGLSAVYEHLAARLGHRRVKEEITAGFAGAGLGLLLLGSAMSLGWFGRLV